MFFNGRLTTTLQPSEEKNVVAHSNSALFVAELLNPAQNSTAENQSRTPNLEIQLSKSKSPWLESNKAKKNKLRDRLKNSPFYAWGLVDDAFLQRRFKEGTVRAIEYFLGGCKGGIESSVLVTSGILTPEEFQKKLIDGGRKYDFYLLGKLLTSSKYNEILTYLLEKSALNQNTLWSKFLMEGSYDSRESQSFYNSALYLGDRFDWEHLFNSGIVNIDKIDSKTDGFDAFEIEHLQEDLTGYSAKARTYSHDKTAHSLVQRMRAQENTQKISEQVAAVLGPEGQGTVEEDFNTVFSFYLDKAKRDKSIPREARKKKSKWKRKKNIALVNEHQAALYKKAKKVEPPKFDRKKRHFDLYARYAHGQMDPFQLAVIAKTAEWYIMGNRSSLFNSVRVVPYSTYGTSLPLVATKVCKGAKMHKVTGGRFQSSMMGANRTFLTHSNSKEATWMHSIPIIGRTTEQNRRKRSENKEEYVVFDSVFDPKDVGIREGEEKMGVNGDIQGLITETIRTIMEVEKREITRAKAGLQEENESVSASVTVS